MLSDPRSPSQPAGEEGRRELLAPSPGLGPPLGGWVAGGRGGGRARDWEKSRRRHRLWRRRRGKHLSGLERNINKRTPAQTRAPTTAGLRQLGLLPALKARPAPLPLLPRPSPFFPAPPPSPGETCSFRGGGGGSAEWGVPRESPSIRSSLPSGLVGGPRLLRQVRGTHVSRSACSWQAGAVRSGSGGRGGGGRGLGCSPG